MYPFIQKERVPVSALFLVSAVLPAVVLGAIIVVTRKSRGNLWWDIHFTFLGIALCITLAAFITNLTKVIVGRPRPDFLARCVPMTSPSSGLVSLDICTQTSLIEKGLRSFPAEHATISFAGLGFLALQIANLANLFRPIPVVVDQQTSASTQPAAGYPGRWIGVFVLGIVAPLILAGWCAWSKVLDNRHHPTDIIAGIILGGVIAYSVYRLHHRPLGLEWYKFSVA